MDKLILGILTATILLSVSSARASAIENLSPLFASHRPVKLKIVAPLSDLSARKDKKYVDGIVYFADRTFRAQIRVRGQYSLQLCEFPKLKVKLSHKDAVGSLFEGNEQFEIGTHCKVDLSEPGMAFPFREALVYHWLNLGGITAYSSRPAIITYVDNSASNTSVTHEAFILESMNSFLHRTDGIELRTLSQQESQQAHQKASQQDQPLKPTPDERVRFDFKGINDSQFNKISWERSLVFEHLIGNSDYFTEGLHNLKVTEDRSGRSSIFPIDFNLSTFVMGYVSTDMIFTDEISAESKEIIANELRINRAQFFSSLEELGTSDPQGLIRAKAILERLYQEIAP